MPNLLTRLAALARGEGKGAPAPSASRRAGAAVAFTSADRPVWTPRDDGALAREGFCRNAVVHRAVRLVAESAAAVPLVAPGEPHAGLRALLALLAAFRSSTRHYEVSMIRHIVLVRFAPATSEEERTAVFGGLSALQAAVPGVLDYAAGENVSPEGRARGYTHAFTFDFADAAARDSYLVHPQHVAAGKRLVAAADGGRDGLLIMDIEVEG